MPGFGKSGTSRISFFKLFIYKVQYLLFDPKSRVSLIRVKNYFLDVFDLRVTWSRSQIVFESFDRRFRSLSKCFHPPVLEVFHVSAHLVSRCRSLCKISIAYALDLPPDKKLSCYHNIFLAERIQAFHQRPLSAGVNRHSTERQFARGRLP